jgi:hypothetical protein
MAREEAGESKQVELLELEVFVCPCYFSWQIQIRLNVESCYETMVTGRGIGGGRGHTVYKISLVILAVSFSLLVNVCLRYCWFLLSALLPLPCDGL